MTADTSPMFVLDESSRKAVDCMLVLKALGEMNRLRIMRLLMSRELDVNTIAERLGLTEYNVSKHLRILSESRVKSRDFPAIGNRC